MQTPYGPAFFKEGHDNGWENYGICFPERKIAMILMTNSSNGESIFKELLKRVMGDTFTPWEWENYIPYHANAPAKLVISLAPSHSTHVCSPVRR